MSRPKFDKGDTVEVTDTDGQKRVGRYVHHYDQYGQHEVAFADTSRWIGPTEMVRALDDDEVTLEVRADLPPAEKPALEGAAAETGHKYE